MSEAQNSNKDWLTRQEAADYLCALGFQISAKTLANLGCNGNAGKGPVFVQSGWRTVRYDRNELQKWAASKSVVVA